MSLDRPLFSTSSVYSLIQLNEVITRYAQNDEQMKAVAESLEQILTTVSTDDILSPADLQAAVDAIYDAGSPIARAYIVSPPSRSLQEIANLMVIQPFSDLIEGTKLNPTAWMPLLRVFSMLKGMIYLVENGPSYDADPVYVKDGSFFFTSITDGKDPEGHLLCDATGTVLEVGGPIYRVLPDGTDAITLIEFMLRRLEFQRLRQLYRLSDFEASIDAKYDSSSGYDFIEKVFTTGDGPEFNRRFPCGYTQAGELLFLRSQAGKYRGADLNFFRPGFSAQSGVEDRIIVGESTIQTPMGLIRIPQSILRWDHLLTDDDRQSNDDGDPVVFVGIRVLLTVQNREGYQNGVADPAVIANVGTGDGMVLMKKNAFGLPIPNFPETLTGTQAEKFEAVAAEGLEHGTVIGFIQQDGVNIFGQYAQMQLDVAIAPMHGRPFFDQAVNYTSGQTDEIGKLGELGTDIDVAPWRAFGTGPRHVLSVIADEFPDFAVDVDQGVLVREYKETFHAQWEVIIPVGLSLMKNRKPFSLDNLNGCTTRFTDAWAIRQVTSVQSSLNTVIFDDGYGQPEVFPEDFIGAEVTFWHADGTSSVTTIVERVGDRLARIPADVLAKIVAGDVTTIDRRKPSSSVDGAYEREVGVTNFVDLRLLVRRMVDTQVVPNSEGLLSPSPSPAIPWTALVRSKPSSLVLDAMAPFADNVAAIASKLRWHYAQKFIALASQRQDMVDVTGTTAELQSYLLRWVQNYEANKNHEWIVGESSIIHWPAKNPITKINLRRYSPPILPGTDDGLTIENIDGWGPVPVLTKYLRSGDNQRYPLRFVKPLVFASERSFSIPGHTKLAGSFRLQPEDTWIVDDVMTFVLYQTQNKNGLIQEVILGTFDLNWREASNFSNATGVFRIDDDATYNPTTGFISINYNQIIDFTVEEPGRLLATVVYHDLSQVHPIYSFNLSQFGLSVSHLADAKLFSVIEGKVEEKTDVIRLEGISISNGTVYLRFNRDDVFKAIAVRGIFKTKWVLRNIAWITITNVSTDANNIPIAVEYDAQNVRNAMTLSTLLEADKRCRQVYIPCATKYGWIDIGQTNIHTEALPQNDSPRFGFFELDDIKGIDTALLVDGPVYNAFKPADVDYRFLEAYVSPDLLEDIRSVAIVRHIVTGERRVFVDIYREANGGGGITAYHNPIDLPTLMDQDVLFFNDTLLDDQWVLDFAGVMVTAPDGGVGEFGGSKLMLAGYWYAGHTLEERAPSFVRFRPDTAQFNSPTKDDAFWRIGDVPMSFLYRGNTLLWADHKRPPA